MLLPAKYDERKWALAKQIGVNHAITKAVSDLSGLSDPSDFDSLRKITEQFKQKGFSLIGLEGDQFDMQPIKLGLPERDQTIEKYIQLLRNMGKLEIQLLCYNFMATIGWFRTRVDVSERGGAQVSGFYHEDVLNQLVSEELRVSEVQLWDNLFYFLEAVLPEAKAAGVNMALHPDDPPISPLKGVCRILTSAASFEKVWKRFPIESNKITFCQASFLMMGEDISRLAEKWLDQGRISFLHIRDVEGDKYNFRETFHDNGPTDMVEMFKIYKKYNFDGPIRPDHAPAMYGETQGAFRGNTSVGYEITGKIFAIGYLKGIYESV
ncbi:mannonate dehydratase [Algoriphagus sp. D3-2-R+10]|uniref:mannonate dehydratase n=1 Tax=Algoriphagus aurantiacus TaxID=3103948 RepID=UPI002B3BA8F5|nr:mannonate dehydratase [Algoriphagus sp. D3-2-R+10]MEB2777380.1 mannonate dehydratase [Algoriphagus sp. D3-2-R+10]